ncbi:MAG: hypothetical protein M3Y86_12160 [Verrucomicrobiota bacterium]|nr:hypothetical protein [Verrucomicrobiota bacterium]
MAAETSSEPKLEIAHVLIMDVVEYSTLFMTEQRAVIADLNRIVRGTAQFRKSEADKTLVRIPTGDGMVLVFLDDVEAPLTCALEIAAAIRAQPKIRLRMGIHSGPVSQTIDVNDHANLAGAGLDVARRVVDCGDDGHILLSRHVAEDLAPYARWHEHLHDLGECEVKHGRRIGLVNFYKGDLGNPALPSGLKRARAEPATNDASGRGGKIALVFITALVLLAAAFLSLKLGWIRRGSGNVVVPEKSIAVLPFKNLSGEPENAYFTDGMQDEILTALAKVGDLKVISRTSVMQYVDSAKRNIPSIGRALKVAHVLEGSVQRSGQRVRVNAQLIDTRTEAHLWANSYDRDIADVFAIQSEIASAIATQLQAKLSPAEQAAIAQTPTTNLAAYDLYMRAKVLLNATTFSSSSKEKYLEAVQLLDSAVGLDANFFEAYCQLAYAHIRLYFFGYDHSPERLALAERAVKTALRLRPDSGQAHLALAQHLYRGYKDYAGAREQLAIARKELPNDPTVYELTGYIDRRQGDWEGSTRNLEHALEFDPRNFFILQQISISYQKLRRFGEEAGTLDRALELVPMDVDTRLTRAEVELDWHAETGPLRATIDAILTENPNAGPAVAENRFLLALCMRDAEEAQRALADFTPDGINTDGIILSRAFCTGLAARFRNDNDAAVQAFTAARAELEPITRAQPDYAQALCVLGLIDAGLGRKEEAVREGLRAVALAPVASDSVNGPHMIAFLAAIYAWTGEKTKAIEQLQLAAKLPGDLSYGQLRLNPRWDALRGEPQFDAVVASLAPK